MMTRPPTVRVADAGGDAEIQPYRTRAGAVQYGTPLGVVMLDFTSPFVPGDVGNASTFGYPVLYRVVPELSVPAILADSGNEFSASVVDAARALVEAGAGAVTSNCGFMLRYQDEVSAAIAPAPVLLSSLLHLPLIVPTVAPDRSVGIITADARVLTSKFIEAHLGPLPRRITIVGLEDAPSFAHTMLDGGATLDAAAIGAETVEAVGHLRSQDPTVAAVLLECAALPPYAHLIQKAAGGLPVYDFTTLIGWLHAARYRGPFGGYF